MSWSSRFRKMSVRSSRNWYEKRWKACTKSRFHCWSKYVQGRIGETWIDVLGVREVSDVRNLLARQVFLIAVGGEPFLYEPYVSAHHPTLSDVCTRKRRRRAPQCQPWPC